MACAHTWCIIRVYIQHQGVRDGYGSWNDGGASEDSKIDALVRKTKEWLGKCKIGMSDKSGIARGEVRKRFGYTSKIDHLFRAISRAALISGASVRNGSDIAKNGCCKSCVTSGRLALKRLRKVVTER